MKAYNLSSPLHELVSCWQQAIDKEIVLYSDRLNAGLRNWSRSDDGIDEQESVSLRAGPCVCSMKNVLKPSNFNSLHHRLYELVSRLPQVINGILLCSERLKGWLGKKKNTRTNACKHVVLFYGEKIEPTSLKKRRLLHEGKFPISFCHGHKEVHSFQGMKIYYPGLERKRKKE